LQATMQRHQYSMLINKKIVEKSINLKTNKIG